ncbi:DNA N-6-adenine-methyltransferase (Dam) [Desulfofundulus thermosubterraneus DSM 16057]|uniref:DNA N-6-adenine-methyltransferase (Dam) n=1 Tax=Desulfofundulus thermosubterraneus DSM 16057 TaxID=1121432 RepID=A0A1M6L1D4_9FIRM|nr:DNA N-6-adenine-methyltransferase (Dam) [Desulfofundulus thermosubterraneus DSM 16057]
MLNEGMFSSRTGEWETPQTFFEALNAEFHFTLDVCARPENAKCSRFFLPSKTACSNPGSGKPAG